MKQTITLSAGPLITLYPAESGTFAIVLHDYTKIRLSRPSRNKAPRRTLSLPEVQPFSGVFSNLDPAMQEWLHNLSVERAGGTMTLQEQEQSFNGLWQADTAFTNFQPNLTFLPNAQDHFAHNPTIKLFNVLTAGAIIKILGPAFTYKGTLVYPFQVIDTDQDYTVYSPATHPWLFFNPVSSHRAEIMKNGRWTGYYQENIVSTFWMYRGHTALPIHGRRLAGIPAGVGLIDAALVHILPPGETWPSPTDL